MRFNRFSFLIFLALIIYMILIGRLFYLQIVKGEYYREISNRNYIKVFYSNPPRGKIYDRNGVLLAYDVPTFDLIAFPYIVRENYKIQELKSILKQLFDIDLDPKNEEVIQKNLLPKITIKKNLSQKDVENFYNYNYLLKGFYLEVVPKRIYTPEANYLPHIIGYVGFPTKEEVEKNPDITLNTLVGKAGVEKIYDNLLRGKAGQKAVLVDAFGRQKRVLWEKDPEKGNDIYLSIDIRLQKIVYEEFKRSGHKSGAVVLVDPNSYQILAALSYPTYDLQKFYEGFKPEEWKALTEDKYRPLLDKVFNGRYPPGSIYKPLVSIAALEEGVITPDTKIASGPEFRIGNYRYRNWNKLGCGYINVAQALEMSCDTFYYQVGLKLGVDDIYKYTKLFGIGEKLNPDIEKKEAIVPNREWKRKVLKQGWFFGDTVNLSIGQGYLSITPFDATKIVVPIANGGKVLKPNILSGYYDNKKQMFVKTIPEVVRNLKIKSWNLDTVKYGMYLVVYGPHGTAKALRNVPVRNAGKTGTAQVYTYSRGKKHAKWELRDHAWFIDFAPYDNPQVAGVVFIEHGESGGSVAAPLMASILRRAYKEGVFEIK
ncbi:MAG: penicillin-binding protein 2 [Sulfurihydrogenibium sp.]|mgnify:CR=1 FL=1